MLRCCSAICQTARDKTVCGLGGLDCRRCLPPTLLPVKLLYRWDLATVMYWQGSGIRGHAMPTQSCGATKDPPLFYATTFTQWLPLPPLVHAALQMVGARRWRIWGTWNCWLSHPQCYHHGCFFSESKSNKMCLLLLPNVQRIHPSKACSPKHRIPFINVNKITTNCKVVYY